MGIVSVPDLAGLRGLGPRKCTASLCTVANFSKAVGSQTTQKESETQKVYVAGTVRT